MLLVKHNSIQIRRDDAFLMGLQLGCEISVIFHPNFYCCIQCFGLDTGKLHDGSQLEINNLFR